MIYPVPHDLSREEGEIGAILHDPENGLKKNKQKEGEHEREREEPSTPGGGEPRMDLT